MKLTRAALAASLTVAFVAYPTVSFAGQDDPVPVAPKVTSAGIGGVDAAALGQVEASTAGPSAGPRSTMSAQSAPQALQAPQAPQAPQGSKAAPQGQLQGQATQAPAAPAAKPATLAVLTGQRSAARFTVAGVSWARAGSPPIADVTVNVRVRENGAWTGWEPLGLPDGGPDTQDGESAKARIGTAPLVSAGADGIQVRVDTPTGTAPADLKVTTIDPGTSPADDNLAPAQPAASAHAAALQPSIITRAQWGADEKLRGGITYNSTVKSIVIHHTAGTNNYGMADAAAQVRGIYAYDTKGLGWADIAYNFLVDKWGRVYEGRAGSITQAVRGAHAMGFNVDTMGIAAMGNYELVDAPDVMVSAMARVAGWKLSQYGVNPLGKVTLTSQGGSGALYAAGQKATLDVINGHKNTSATLCPGRYLYPKLGSLRAQAAAYASGTPAPPPRVPVAGPSLYAVYGTLVLRAGAQGDPVTDLQLELNRRGFNVGDADGDWGPMTTAGVVAFQKATNLTADGVVSAVDWRVLSGLSPTAQPGELANKGFDGDNRGDLIGVKANGELLLYSGDGRGYVTNSGRKGTGWNMFNTVFSPGDFTGDGKADLIARKPTGELFLYPGDGQGGFAGGGRQIGTGWQMFSEVFSPGDWTGDGNADLLARTPAGALYLYPGDGKGGFAAPGRAINAGWNVFSQIITPGDFTGDRKADLIARKPNGQLFLYAGDGAGGFAAPGRQINAGWNIFDTVVSAGDLNADGRADLVARKPNGQLFLYAGDGAGGFAAPGRLVGSGWQGFASIVGVR